MIKRLRTFKYVFMSIITKYLALTVYFVFRDECDVGTQTDNEI